jgi:hypothetical protein
MTQTPTTCNNNGLLIIPISSTCFGKLFCPSSEALDCVLQLVVWCTHDVAGHRPATSWVHYTTSCNTQSGAPEDGRNHRPKHVELIGIINKPLLLHLVGVYIIYINDARSSKYQIKCRVSLGEENSLQIYTYFCISLLSMKTNPSRKGHVISVGQFSLHFEFNYTNSLIFLLECVILVGLTTPQAYIQLSLITVIVCCY